MIRRRCKRRLVGRSLNLPSTATTGSQLPKSGGIEAVVSAMQRHEDSAELQELACSVLDYLTRRYSNDGNRIAVQSVLGLVELANLATGAAAA